MSKQLLSLGGLFLKIAICICFYRVFIVVAYFTLIFATGHRYTGYGGSPYSIRAKVVEKSDRQVRLEIINHSILIDPDALLNYPPIEKIKKVSHQSIKLFKKFELGEVVVSQASLQYEQVSEKPGKTEKILDILSVKKDRLDPLGADIGRTFLITATLIYLIAAVIFIRLNLSKLLRQFMQAIVLIFHKLLNSIR